MCTTFMYVSTSIWPQLACRNTSRHSLNSAKGTPKDENAKIMYVSIQSAYVRLLGAQFHLCFCPQRQRGTKQCIPSGRVFRVQRARCSTSSGHSCFVNQHQQVVRPPLSSRFYRHFHILKPRTQSNCHAPRLRTGVLPVAVALQKTCVVAVAFVLAMYSGGSSNTLQYSSGSS